MGFWARTSIALAATIWMTALAGADTPAPDVPSTPAEETPWGKGVSPERKEAALQLMQDGNALFLKNQFPEALAKYQEALAQWDHPAIHFNVVRVLLALDRPLEAEESLDKALLYGAAPLEDEHYAEALGYKSLLAGRIGTLEVACKQAGVQIKLDGAAVLACPGKVTKKLLPGPHAVVGTKPSYQTDTKDVVLAGGATTRVNIELVTLAQATVYRTRWATWKPWAVAGGGAAIAGIGLVLRMVAKSDKDDLDAAFQSKCQPDCTSAQYAQLGFADKEQSIERNSRIAVGTMIGGGVIVAAGIAGVLLNRPKPYVKERRTPVSVVPSLMRGGAGIVLSGEL